ncbi:MAG: hypothetical protein AB8E82_10680 [Aureispira sp.]
MNKQYYLVGLALVSSVFFACKKKVQADYEAALAAGTILEAADTIQVKLNEKILFDFSFSDGVNPIHYAWNIHALDSSNVKYLETQEFHFAAPNVVGGPASGIHSYQVLQAGLHKLVFYNPFYNQEFWQKEQETEDVYLVWKALKQDFSINDTLVEHYWTRQVFENHWIALQAAKGSAQDSLWQVLYEHTYTTDYTPDSTTLQRLRVKWAAEKTPFTSSNTTLELLDTLLGSQYEPNRITWHDLRQEQKQKILLHDNLDTKVYYVEVIQ